MSYSTTVFARQAALLASAALVAALAIPQAARAACNVAINPNTVTCAADTTTTATVNTNAANPNSSDGTQSFTTPGAITLTVNSGVTVNGEGLQIQQPGNGGITASNAGFVGGFGINSGLALNSTGAITYTGNGGARGLSATTSDTVNINTGTGTIIGLSTVSLSASGDKGVTVTTNGSIGFATLIGLGATTDTGTATVNVNGGHVGGNIGIYATANTGNIEINANGGTIGGGSIGIIAGSTSGNVTINGNGSVITTVSLGISGTLNSGNFAINLLAGSVTANSVGITISGAGSGAVSVFIGAGTSVSGVLSGLQMAVTDNATATVLGTLSSTGSAAFFRGTLNIGNGGAAGTVNGAVVMADSNAVLNFNHSNTSTLASVIDGPGTVRQIGSGTAILTAVNTYTGATVVNAGTLQVDGSIASSSLTSVNNGGTLSGSGIVGNTAINNGGRLTPGNGTAGTSINVTGSLALQSGAVYMVQLNPATSSFANVTGTATLGGATVSASFAPGAYIARQYLILHTTAGVTGSFDSVSSTGLPGFARTLSYTPTDVLLNLSAALGQGSALPGSNQQAAAAAINGFFNNGGALSSGFLNLFALTGSNLLNGLTQVSGETATGSQQTTFNAMSQFMGLMTDPFTAGRGDGANAPAYAEEDSEANAYASRGKRSKGEREAYAAVYSKAPLARNYDPRWSVWAAGFGGSQTTDGNTTLGSNNTTSRVFGMAAGADYIFSPRTIAGFALAGGGTSFSVTGGGSGRTDLFQAGAFIRHTVGQAYVTGALAYGWQDVTTDRTVTVAGVDRLRAQFNANAFSGRAEAGYRFVSPWIGGVGVTPYAAGQFTTFELPAYTEQVVSGANTFALGYAAKSVTVTRSELGFRADKSFAMESAILTLRGRAAWAHDFNPDRAIGATFQTLPGASFVVNGARQASDSALSTASAEVKWMNGWSATGTFEGEFSNVTRSYAGKGVARYTW